MAETGSQPDKSQDQEHGLRSEEPEAEGAEDAEKRLQDLDPEEEEAADVQGGQRAFGRYGRW